MFFSTNKNVDDDHDHSFCSKFPDDHDHPDHSLFHLPISFFPFPSPFDVDEYDQQQQQQQQPSNNTNKNSDQKMKKKKKKMMNIPIVRKKILSKKKDRHSKIKTARGVRDRRMRLSLPVARQFFALQDMLGVDKPSKVVEWLLLQSTPQILNLSKHTHFSNINYYSDPVLNHDHHHHHHQQSYNNNNGDIQLKSDDAKKKQPIIRKTMAKEVRELARARARARTMEKKTQHVYHHHHNLHKNPIIMTSTQSQQPINVDCQFQNFSSNFEIMANWSPSDSTFDYLLHQTQNFDLHEQMEFEDSDIFG